MEFLGRSGYYYPIPDYRMTLPVPLNARYRPHLVSYPRCTCECYCQQSYEIRGESMQRYDRTHRREELRGFAEHTHKQLDDVFSSVKPGRRNRTTYKRWQIDELERAFLINPYPTSVFKKTLAVRLGLRDSRVQVWFQNRRAKSKRDRQNANPAIYTTDHDTLDHESAADSISTCTEDVEEIQRKDRGSSGPHEN